MTKPIIQAVGVGKRYRLSHQVNRSVTLRDSLANALRSLGRRKSEGGVKSVEEFWALKDVSFEIMPGEVIGIIGRNGAGKSTLLKILSRITEPTVGEVTLRGHVASLLEVGTGFHGELTGRENIFLNGTILGLTREQIRTKFDDIVEFAEVEKFLDTPVKRYSSGMYMRLAFAVAAHLEPEILIVDEVLAVGDAEFQKKCLGKMAEVVNYGRTVIFVSHNMAAIQQLCRSAIFMKQGRIAHMGETEETVRYYLGEHGEGHGFQRAPQIDGRPTLTAGKLIYPESKKHAIELELAISAAAAMRVSLDVRLTDSMGVVVAFGSLGVFAASDMISLESGVNRITIELLTEKLAVGSYRLSFDLTEPEVTFYDRLNDCFTFELTRAPGEGRERVLRQLWGHGSNELPIRRIANPNH